MPSSGGLYFGWRDGTKRGLWRGFEPGVRRVREVRFESTFELDKEANPPCEGESELGSWMAKAESSRKAGASSSSVGAPGEMTEVPFKACSILTIDRSFGASSNASLRYSTAA